MALDPNILLRGKTPNVLSALTSGISAGQQLRRGPLEQRMAQQKLLQMQAAEEREAQLAPLRERFLQAQAGQLESQTLARDLPSKAPAPIKLSATDRLIDPVTLQEVVGPSAKADEDIGPQVKNFRTRLDKFQGDLRKTDVAFRKINAAPDTASGDMSLIFGFMKLLDPGSTVREGEFASAESAAGIPTRIVNAYNRALTGERLSAGQRKEFIDTAGVTFQAQQQGADLQTAQLLQQADQDGIPRLKIMGAKRLREFEKRAADALINQQGAGKAPPQAQAAPEEQIDPELLQFMSPEDRALFNGTN